MDILTPERITALLGFLFLLLLAWLAVRLRTGGLAGLAQSPARNPLEVRAVKPLGEGTRAILLRVSETDVLVVAHRKSGAQILPLPAFADGTGPSPLAAATPQPEGRA